MMDNYFLSEKAATGTSLSEESMPCVESDKGNVTTSCPSVASISSGETFVLPGTEGRGGGQGGA